VSPVSASHPCYNVTRLLLHQVCSKKRLPRLVLITSLPSSILRVSCYIKSVLKSVSSQVTLFYNSPIIHVFYKVSVLKSVTRLVLMASHLVLFYNSPPSEVSRVLLRVLFSSQVSLFYNSPVSASSASLPC
jgi:hypothetical protein